MEGFTLPPWERVHITKERIHEAYSKSPLFQTALTVTNVVATSGKLSIWNKIGKVCTVGRGEKKTNSTWQDLNGYFFPLFFFHLLHPPIPFFRGRRNLCIGRAQTGRDLWFKLNLTSNKNSLANIYSELLRSRGLGSLGHLSSPRRELRAAGEAVGLRVLSEEAGEGGAEQMLFPIRSSPDHLAAAARQRPSGLLFYSGEGLYLGVPGPTGNWSVVITEALDTCISEAHIGREE